MSLSQTLVPPGERLDSQQKFLELYKSLADTCKKLIPLEEKVLSFQKKVTEGQISVLEAKLLKKDMDEVLALYGKVEKTSADIVALRKQIPPNEAENEVNAIIKTKAYIFKSLCKNPAEEKGLKFADRIIEEHHKEVLAKLDEMKRDISKHFLE
ncbi:MAG: hypothetical protein NT130_03705 [Candidatus Micrarchaeota archaeon]|nr:hypothetical protein [Candidatus Micrarchaeota archaeon]